MNAEETKSWDSYVAKLDGTRPQDRIELYIKRDFANGLFVTYEKSPIPGMHDAPVLSRETESESKEAAERYIEKYGSCFKSERLVV